MIGIVVAAHGALAEALISTVRQVVQPVQESLLQPVAVEPEDSTSSFVARLQAAIAAADQGSGVVVLTDMFGGTPANHSIMLLQPGKVEVLTGVNLPMLVKAVQVCQTGLTLGPAAAEICAAGRRSIAAASELLQPTRKS
jgi:PTS system mannose-specific IIA component